MPSSRKDAITHLDDVIREFHLVEEHDWNYLQTRPDIRAKTLIRMRTALNRLAPPGSAYLIAVNSDDFYDLAAAVQALRDDYAGDYLQTFRELLNADLFSDFLGMAEYLLQDERLKTPAAVLAGGVLEEHLRKLCAKHGIDVESTDGSGKVHPKRADAMNTDLRKAGVYGQNDQKQVTAWLGIRNSAAHAKHDEFDEAQVTNLIMGVRTFVSRFPA